MSDVAKIRGMLGLTQQNVADRATLTRSIVSEVEGKRKGLSVAASLKAAPVLGVAPGVLYLGTQLAAIKAKVEEEEITEEAAADKLLRVLRTLLEKFADVEDEEGADELITQLEELLSAYTGRTVDAARGGKGAAGVAAKGRRGGYHPAFEVAFKAAGGSVDPAAYEVDDGRDLNGVRLSAARLRDAAEHEFEDVSSWGTSNIPAGYDGDEDEDDLEERDALGRSTRPRR